MLMQSRGLNGILFPCQFFGSYGENEVILFEAEEWSVNQISMQASNFANLWTSLSVRSSSWPTVVLSLLCSSILVPCIPLLLNLLLISGEITFALYRFFMFEMKIGGHVVAAILREKKELNLVSLISLKYSELIITIGFEL